MSRKILLKRSSVTNADGSPKLPNPTDLEHGELAINFSKGKETFSIKNSDGEIASFTHEIAISDNPTNDLLEKLVISQTDGCLKYKKADKSYDGISYKVNNSFKESNYPNISNIIFNKITKNDYIEQALNKLENNIILSILNVDNRINAMKPIDTSALNKAIGFTNVNTYTPNKNSNYIKDSVSLVDADNKLDVIIKSLSDSTSSSINSITENISAINKTIGEHVTNMTSLSSSVDSLNKNVETIQNSVSSNTTQLESVNQTINSHATLIGNNTTEISKIDKSVSTMSSTIEGHTSSISTINSTIEGHTSSISTMDSAIKANTQSIGTINTTIEGHTKSISTMNNTIKNHTKSINTINTKLNSIVKKLVKHTSSETTMEISENALHVWDVVDTLNITLKAPSDATIVNEYAFEFSTGVNGATLTLPTNIKWSNSEKISKCSANATYHISIINNLAVGGVFQ